MPDLTGTVRWVDYLPDLLGNLEAERPFYFRLNGSMSKDQLRAMNDALGRSVALPELPKDATEEQRAEKDAAERKAMLERDSAALEPYVKFGEEPLTCDGREIKTLREYLELVLSPLLIGLGAYFEVTKALTAANALDARMSFSYGRPSGGSTSTGPKRPRGQAVAR